MPHSSTPLDCSRQGSKSIWPRSVLRGKMDAEQLMRTIIEKEVDLSEYEDYPDADRQLGRFLDEVYMHKRIHSSLGYLTPVEFEHWLTQQTGQPPID